MTYVYFVCRFGQKAGLRPCAFVMLRAEIFYAVIQGAGQPWHTT